MLSREQSILKTKKKEVLINAGDIYNELYYTYKNKYNKKIDRLSAKNKKKLDYKQLRLSDNYLYSSEEEQEEEQEKQEEKQEKQGEQDKKYFDLNKFIEQIINKEGLPINNELFKKHFKLEKPILMYKVLYETNNDKQKKSKLVNILNSGLEDLEK